jgi:hypothetical protein
MEEVNRSLLVVKPKRPFLEWARKVDERGTEVTLDFLREDCNAYLIPEYEFDEDQDEILTWCFEDIFAEELFSWSTDEADWPPHRTLKMFKEWFDLEFHSMVHDVDDAPLEHIDEGHTADDDSSNGGNGFKNH